MINGHATYGMTQCTNYGRMMATSQIIFCQYHTCGIFESSLKTKFFVEKNQLNDGNYGQGTNSAKMRTDSLAKNTLNTPKFIRLTYPIGPKVWDNIEKKASLAVRNL